MGEICVSISSGKNKKKFKEGEYMVYGSTGIIGMTDFPVYCIPQILVARVGANAGFVQLVDGNYDVSDNTLIVNIKTEYNIKYLYYLMISMNINKYAKGGGQPLITAKQLKNLVIPIPPIEEQRRIVEILDKFETLCTDLCHGLPAEIEARRKQYEHYRDQLLTFKRLTA